MSVVFRAANRLRALAQGVLFLAFVGGVLAAVGIGTGAAGVWSWALASFAALLVWWLANAKSPGLRDPDTPTGGSLTKDLPGTLTGYTTE